MHTDLTPDFTDDQLDAATAAMFNGLHAAGALADAFAAMTDDERRLVQAAVVRHQRRQAAGTAPAIALPAGLDVPAPMSAAGAIGPAPDDDEPDDDDEAGPEYGTDEPGSVWLDDPDVVGDDDARYMDCSTALAAGGRGLELGAGRASYGDHFTRAELERILGVMRAGVTGVGNAAAQLDDPDADDGRYVSAEDEADDAPGRIWLELGAGDEGGGMAVTPAELNRLAANLAATLLADTLEALDENGRGELVPAHNATINVVTLPDGRRIVHKAMRVPEGDDDAAAWARRQVDAEMLAAQVAIACGALTPQVTREYTRSPHDVWAEYVAGRRIDPAELTDAEALALGLLDALIGNQHRQVMRGDDGQAYGIDHTDAWLLHVAGDPARPFNREAGAPMSRFVDGDHYRPVPPVTPEQLAEVRGRLEALRPDFEFYGHGDWLDYSLGVVDELARQATPLHRPTKVDSDDGMSVRVTQYPNAVRLDLVFSAEDPDVPAHDVLLDAAAVAALEAAVDDMAAAEKAATARYKAAVKRLAGLDSRIEDIENGRYGANHGATVIDIERRSSDLLSRMDAKWKARRERLGMLSDEDRAAHDALDDAWVAARDAGDRAGMNDARAAQRRIIYGGMTDAELRELADPSTDPERRRELRSRPGGLPDGEHGRRSLHEMWQREWDDLNAQYQVLKHEAQAHYAGARPLTDAEQAELDDLKRRRDELEGEIGEMEDWQTVGGGEFPAGDGQGTAVVWESQMTGDGRVVHSIDRRPADAPDDWRVDYDGQEIPPLTLAQVRRVAKAAQAKPARPTPAPAVPLPE